LSQYGPALPEKEVPRLREFSPRSVDGHARANRQKPGGIAHKEGILRVHLVPALESKRLDAIYGTRSARISRCAAHPRGRFRSWPAIAISRRHSATASQPGGNRERDPLAGIAGGNQRGNIERRKLRM